MDDKKNTTQEKKFIKNYEILGIIGKGGMGEVFLAKHPTLKREIILKRLKIREKEAQERFLQEAKVMLDFRNENIVQFYDHFKEATSTYIAMEYVKGKALNKIIEENESIPVPLALFILYQIALGLYHAHSKKVIHRDIKPHNILISKDGDVKLTDFGIAMKTTDLKDITKTGVVVGTPAYMSPEQFSSKKEITYQSDIYSLGVVFYEMLTGQRPFKNEYSTEVLDAIVNGKFVSPQKYVKDLPAIAQKILSKTLRPNPKDRFKSLFPLIKILKQYFKPYNILEMKDAIKRIVVLDKNLLNAQFFVHYNKKKASNIYKIIALSVFFIGSVLGTLFFYTNSYYELVFPYKYGKVSIEFNKANLNEDNIFLGIDNKYQKAIFDNPKNKSLFRKEFYLPEGEHSFTVVSGSYKNTKRYYIYSITDQKKYKINFQYINIPVFKLTPKEVIVYFRFWNALNMNELLFQFDSYPYEKIEESQFDYLKILSNKKYITIKDYFQNVKNFDKKGVPFYSSKKYFFKVENFKNNGILYDTKDFEVNFELDDRTVVVHIPLNPVPATINFESNTKNLPVIINENDSGLIYDSGNYNYKKYKDIHYIKKDKNFYGTLEIPPGSYNIKILKNGDTKSYKLTSGRIINLIVKKENGKYIY
ncbi:MAG: hypothetical protein A2086_08735 [Spirochaetes bacterium GWD1_27_9]|nr:MAG: hypothetical protein A2Y34_14770 [Spirochaetes bacterium GWC1_27_15]OHD40452.1 MAG: hypothetical protein A2086_08735 [Spirochaetes bacterium GWD1_27_9]